MELKTSQKNCFICLQNVQHHGIYRTSSFTRPGVDVLKKKSRKIKITEECKTLENELQVIFLLRNILKIPQDVCQQLLQHYGNPSLWIYCCDSCSVLVNNARDMHGKIHGKMKSFQRQFENIQKELQNTIVLSIKSKDIQNDISNNRAPVIIRSFIEKVYNDDCVNTIEIKIEDCNDFNEGEVPFHFKSTENVNGSKNCVSAGQPSGNMNKNKLEENRRSVVSTSKQTSNEFSITGKRVYTLKKDLKKKFKCTVCDISFSSTHSLTMHNKIHSNKKKYSCKQCDKTFSTESLLKDHIKDNTEKSRLKLEGCEENFLHSSPLIKHSRIHKINKTDSPEPKNLCNVCGKSFKYAHSLRIHLATHTGEFAHSCDICGKGFSRLDTLKRHVMGHLGEKPYKCDSCGKGFVDSCDLKGHQRIHTGEKPYCCTHCELSFTHSSHLRRHTMAHTGLKPCKCEICGKTFARPANLRNHMYVHTRQKPYECEICGRKFVEGCVWKKHQETHKEDIGQNFILS